MVLDPINVLAFSLFPSGNRRYLGVLLRMHLIFSVCFVIAVAATLAMAPYLNFRGLLIDALAGLLIATPCVLLFWLARCFAYLEFSPGKALAGSVAYCCTQALGLAIAYGTGGLSPLRVFLCNAAAGSVASACLLLRYRRSETPSQQGPSLFHVLSRHWQFGRWGSGTVALYWMQTSCSSFISGYFLGFAGVGALNAMIGLLLPMAQVVFAVVRIALPRISRIYTLSGAEATHRPVLRVAGVLTAVTGAYWLLLAAASGPVFRLLYGERFFSYAYLVPVIGLTVLSYAGATTCDIAFNSIQQPHTLFPIKVLMAVVTVLISAVTIWRFGLPGAAFALPACGFLSAASNGYETAFVLAPATCCRAGEHRKCTAIPGGLRRRNFRQLRIGEQFVTQSPVIPALARPPYRLRLRG